MVGQPAQNVEDEYYMTAFHECGSDRPPSMSGVAPIPFSAIDRYAQRYRITGKDFDELKYMIRVLDNVFVGHFNSQIIKSAPKPSKAKFKGK